MLDSKAFANAAAVTSAVVFIVCRVLVGVMPGTMFSIAQSWMHTIALEQTSMMGTGLWSGWLLGLITLVIITWVIAYLFATLYNNWSKK